MAATSQIMNNPNWNKLDDIRGCIRHANLANREWLAHRLSELYRAALVEMYGEQEAQAFLNRLKDPDFGEKRDDGNDQP